MPMTSSRGVMNIQWGLNSDSLLDQQPSFALAKVTYASLFIFSSENISTEKRRIGKLKKKVSFFFHFSRDTFFSFCVFIQLRSPLNPTIHVLQVKTIQEQKDGSQ